MRRAMVRRTINVSEAVDRLIRQRVAEEGSYSAAVARLVEAGTRAARPEKRPALCGERRRAPDLGIAAERYLRAAPRRRR